MKTESVPGMMQTTKQKSRFLRGLLRILIAFIVLMIIIGVAVYIYSLYTQTHYRITFYQETSGKVSGNIRIAVISDIHNREYGENNRTLISDIRALDPDLILFPGDMVILDEEDYQPMLNLVSELSGIAPCYGVLGNHESERIYYRDDRELPEKFKNAGLKLLRNATEEIRIRNDVIQLIGVEGSPYGFEAYGGREFMDKTVINPYAYSILMDHVPIIFEPQLSIYDFDLGIAGHVHGGIVRLPFIGGLYTQEEGFFPRFTAGEYKLEKQQILIISAGLGDSKPFPPRINNLPELVVIDINRY
ncbi:metallophosphoesterase [Clostridiales bacterium]|nr:metallophosphoesterase [Clostridiales bacterium]